MIEWVRSNTKQSGLAWFGLVWFYSISNAADYLMLNPVFTYILNIWFVNTFYWHTQLNDKQFYFEQFNLAYVNKVKLFQVLLCITNYSIKHQSVVYTQLNDQTILFNLSHLFALSLNVQQFYLNHRWAQSGAITLGQSGPGSNGNEGVLFIPQSSRITGASSSDCLMSYQDTLWWGVLPSYWHAVSVFNSPSWLGSKRSE